MSLPSEGSRRTFDRWLLVAAVVTFVATRVWLVAFFEPALPDVAVYFEYALNTVDLEYAPYSEVPQGGTLEYPPLAYWTIAAPRFISSEKIDPRQFRNEDLLRAIDEYGRFLKLEMLVGDVVSLVLVVLIVRRRRPDAVGLAALGYVLSTTALTHVLHARLDIGMTMLVLLWAWTWLKYSEGDRPAAFWQLASYAVLGLGVSYKLVPIVVLPFMLIADVRAVRREKSWFRLLAAVTAFVVTAGGPFLIHYLEAQEAVFKLFAYHSQRPIEIESLPGSLLLVGKFLGLQVAAGQSYGSWNLFTASAEADKMLTLASTIVVASLLVGLGGIACLPRRLFVRDDAYRFGCLALVVTMTFGKVLSIQYLLWGLPLLILLAVDLFTWRRLAVVVGLTLVIALLSTTIFPYLFFLRMPWGSEVIENPYSLCPQLHPLPCAILIARNALLVGAVVWVAAGLWSRSPQRTREPLRH